MFSLRQFNLVKLLSQTISHKSNQEKREELDTADDVADKGNPWQHSLERLKTEHKYNFERISKSEELSNMCVDLSNEAEDKPQKKSTTEHNLPKQSHARAGDKTINDMKSWWKDSLSAASEKEINISELPGKARLLKRWFQ